MAIRLVALDVDGTLLDEHHYLAPRARAAVLEARRRGVTVALATGRMYRSAVPWVEALGLDRAPILAYNGAWVADWPEGRVRRHCPVDLDTARAVAAYCDRRELFLQAYVDDHYYLPRGGPQADHYRTIAGFDGTVVGPMEPFLAERGVAPTKLLLQEPPEVLAQVEADLRAQFGDSLYITWSRSYFLEIMDRCVSKGAALEQLANALNIPAGDVLAVGDNFNDLPMLEYAGVGVAIAGAPSEVAARADFVASGGPGEGAAEAIERFVLGGVQAEPP